LFRPDTTRPSSDTVVTQPQIIVRTATEDDLSFVSQDGHLPEAIVRRKVRDGDVYVARWSDKRVGYLRLDWLWSRLPYIELVLVLEPYRRTGVGRSILAHVETEIASQGHAAVYSSSQVDEREPQAWHRRMGFEECGLITGLNEGGVGEVFFRKSIGPSAGEV
jgi:GNAT superfamily N-acetyltransferase